MNYETIKQTAKELGIKIDEMIALAPQNDPFYVGRPAEMQAAQWFADYWAHFGYGNGVHLRRIHYRMVSQSPPVIMPNGAPYENTMNCWSFLNNASKWARYLGMVDAALFVDRRNPDAIIRVNYDYEERELSYHVPDDDYAARFPALGEIYIPTLPDRPPSFVDFEVTGYDWLQPPVHVEIWCEKTTMNDILEPLAQRQRLNLVTGAGELSITSTLQFMDRVIAADRPARIIYISDFDPAGLGMPISIARKIEYWQHELAHLYGELDIRLEPIVLTLDQVKSYRLPRVPVKDSDKRKPGWERDFGTGAVELDALEALRPGELRRIVETAVTRYRDNDYESAAHALRGELEADLASERRIVLYSDDGIGSRVADMTADYNRLVDELAEITAEIESAIEPYQQRLAAIDQQLTMLAADGKAINDDIAARLMGVELDMDDYALPEPAVDDPDDCLYDSRRDYVDQLHIYKLYRHDGVTV